MHEALTAKRAEIDGIDAQIATLLKQRAAAARACQALKAGAPLYSARREEEILLAHKDRQRAWKGILQGSRAALLDTTRAPAPAVLGARGFAVIAGPCSIESEAHAFETAEHLAALGVTRMRGGCWKPRTSPFTFQGHGLAALRWMRAACDRHALELWTEIRDIENLAHAALIDVAWIGARNAQNFELLQAAGRVCGRVVLKRGPAMTVEEWLCAADYLRIGGAHVALCERGIKGADPMLRNTLDLAGAVLARAMGGLEVLADPSHGTGLATMIAPMVNAARGAGLDGVIVEVHPRPAESVTDAAQAISFEDLARLLRGAP